MLGIVFQLDPSPPQTLGDGRQRHCSGRSNWGLRSIESSVPPNSASGCFGDCPGKYSCCSTACLESMSLMAEVKGRTSEGMHSYSLDNGSRRNLEEAGASTNGLSRPERKVGLLS
ncbi:hypothetical protein AG1IA_08618 [Rhizoctonia solani AG-1 IA]|uniref:Uncharacterized protein n=1 Tax=Thanatephorus cucumeris (strain AG1-IA) TaxID=983506 RepID=L8WHF3_THACA|nr:hypothetical protein AG1IA_08618 [Rhizoctonia solani AG-1 IA]